MSTSTTTGLFSTLRPMGLPPTPIVSLFLTYAINVVATPRMYYSSKLLGENNQDPASLLARAEQEKGVVSPEQRTKIIRSKAAAANLAEAMPLYLVASLVGWLGGVSPEVQNSYHAVWFLSRVGYKWAYLNAKGEARSAFHMVATIATLSMLFVGGNALHAKTALFTA
ncbi:membrane-associated eicosanoid glutathione metabolism protein [Diplodia corticola]|uniref:Membrane-associated eicosanoid glutathione metabolism protein n=1 Tax=Diplodia corticola TaxID=236234 RepID=A0A1J9SG98_9PEZI|nr:membrane-associated eicosanoid glutathione metabolism protein [Diplodia corticola]OJD38836.1 membrane-associated eicosanoid glutathione metabolism protein [Diplodia corticola]